MASRSGRSHDPSTVRLFRTICVLLVCLYAAPVIAQKADSLLLVGNSFTFYNNGIHTHLRAMLKEAEGSGEAPWKLKSLTLSGGKLHDHRQGLQQTLENGSWDIVALQGHSLEAYDPARLPDFEQAAHDLVELARSNQSTPMLFMTWAYDGRPEMTAVIAENYMQTAERENVKVIPVGLAFEQALASIDGVNLYHPDGKHPSLEGTYLAASVFFSVLTGKSPANLAYDAGLNSILALQLRQSAWASSQ